LIGIAFASGSAATSTLILMNPIGGHIISVNDVYGGTYRFLYRIAKELGYQISFVDLKDPESIKSALQSNTCVRKTKIHISRQTDKQAEMMR
jgi:cystathionine gamma-lyase